MSTMNATPTNGDTATSIPVLASIDQGTTSTRVLIFHQTHILVQHQEAYSSIYPQPGWVEQDPEVIWRTVVKCLRRTIDSLTEMNRARHAKNLLPYKLRAVGVTNQRETLVCWDKETHRPLHPAIVWLDTRTQSTVQQMIDRTPSKSADDLRVSFFWLL
jgi:glycerol kinase